MNVMIFLTMYTVGAFSLREHPGMKLILVITYVMAVMNACSLIRTYIFHIFVVQLKMQLVLLQEEKKNCTHLPRGGKCLHINCITIIGLMKAHFRQVHQYKDSFLYS